MATTAVREIEIRIKGKGRGMAATVTNPEAAAAFFRGIIGQDVREQFVALYLDGRNHPIGWRIVSVGTANESFAHPREVFQAAVGLGAVQVVVAHNHPSGDTRPSLPDLEVTQRLSAAGEILGIHLIDHLVIGQPGFTSIRTVHPERFRL
ncbi:MAG: hypothetical protein A3E78_11725 [Alphaproteobacteria bacterium RIFCSPHIGHO2_12_FULL_63_12]|nr:MAG: hypothetical protein A3E78_11725 [Alphaproteobacteria bacterium RIFCSPHIGHO2_12_FULL_63_12]